MRDFAVNVPDETRPSLKPAFHACPVSTVNLATGFNESASN
jgi:ferredoxin